MYDYEILSTILSIVDEHELNISESDIFDFLKIKKRWPIKYHWGQPSVEIITQFSGCSQSDIFDSDNYFVYDKWFQYYEMGFTTIISSVLDLNESLRRLQSKLIKYTGNKIDGNFYFSKGSSKNRISFDDHKHHYRVIVKPIYGKTKWRLSGEEFEVEEKSFLIEREELHCAYECVDKKLSLTLNFI